MIRLVSQYYFLCAINSLHPTIFVEDGKCVAMCDENADKPHGCYDNYGQSLTDCFDNRGRSTLCDAYIYEITSEDYEIVKNDKKTSTNITVFLATRNGKNLNN